jgi:hypothetical protein
MIEKCQVFTPPKIVLSMLDLAGYKENIFNKKFLENASGDGVIFLAAIERYIKNALLEGYNTENIKNGLEQNLHAYEIDSTHVEKCIESANIIAKTYGIYDVKWSIKKKDFLRAEIIFKYDFVIGNPPYIKYNEIPSKERLFITEAFETCKKGKPDYCYPFIEKSIDILSDSGILVYLIPSSIFKNEFSRELREKIKTGLTYIRDFTSIKLFPVLTQSAIIKFENSNKTNVFLYEDVANDRTSEIIRGDLKYKWVFDKKYKNSGSNLFKDYFIASSSIATLCNDAFLLADCDLSLPVVDIDGVNIETSVIKKAVSIKSQKYRENRCIIFPYSFDSNGGLIKYSENIFQSYFPGCVTHLKKFEERLKNRKSDKSAKWFEYGRSQAIQKMQYRKLLVSKIFTNKIKVYSVEANTIPYAGNIVVQNSNISLDVAKRVLESDLFLEYAIKVGSNASGKSHQISAKDINNFRFNIERFL